ncbi:putative methyltransferase-domain-containing protein [Plectosphaerella plurivora]|uniref:25S rRNA adenine-N(1) methyltransferase n=1 Tax=Plectosphaerella plurivora TaxID=936078 RepID=A0A9P9A6F3_9PEZI|nr:putative methyltransferase-domain-containing protein [Plectosphaerella plurivora]
MAYKKAPSSLSKGRPPTLRHKSKSISRKETRTLINAHHTLHKRRQQAISAGDASLVVKIDKEISDLGGLEEYQRASLQGQRNDRGGDSSKILLDWMKPAHGDFHSIPSDRLPRMLEVGALSTSNACSKSRMFSMTHIDLNSQQPGILQQDFMDRPLPASQDEQFDVISLSLVVNYVPDPVQRGQMLLRSTQFLREPSSDFPAAVVGFLPSLFLVLPRSCVANSRYCNLERLTELMQHLGYTQSNSKFTNKLAYFLWKKTGPCSNPMPPFPKKEVNPGHDRNNFAIILRSS